MVEITVEILDILATATKDMKRNAASESDVRLGFRDAYAVSEKFFKMVIGRTDLEDGMKKLDKLTNEEVAMASAQLLKVAHNIDKNVLAVQSEVQLFSNNIKAVDNKVQTMADGKQPV